MFRRIMNLLKGFFGLFVGGLEKRNPEALLEAEKESLRKQIADFNSGLAAHAALVERLISQVRKFDSEEADLRARTRATLQAGNREAAGASALRLREVEREHDAVRGQLENAEKRYHELVRARDVSVKTAREKIEQLRRGIDDLKVQKAMAELNEMAAGMVTSIGGAGDTLNRLQELVEDERAKAAGRSRVARDTVEMAGVEMKESEQKALGEMALADFAAAEGIELEPQAAAAAVSATVQGSGPGTMGPGISQ